jgi:hypothetical protein
MNVKATRDISKSLKLRIPEMPRKFTARIQLFELPMVSDCCVIDIY